MSSGKSRDILMSAIYINHHHRHHRHHHQYHHHHHQRLNSSHRWVTSITVVCPSRRLSRANIDSPAGGWVHSRAKWNSPQQRQDRPIHYTDAVAGVSCDRGRSSAFHFNPLDFRGNYSATSNNMKLVHWQLMGGLLHLVQRAGDWAEPQPAQAHPRCTKCNSPPIDGQCTNHCW